MSENTNIQKNLLPEIKKLHGEIVSFARVSLQKAIRIGELLKSKKSSINHGDWLPWVKKSLPFSERVASNYLRCFEERARLKSVQCTNLAGALLVLRTDKKEAQTASAPPPRRDSVPAQVETEQEQPKEQPVTSQAPPPRRNALTKSKLPLDGTGCEIPVESMHLWSRGDEAREVLSHISILRSKLKNSQNKKDPLFCELDFTDDIVSLDRLFQDCKLAVPFAVCPKCQGKLPQDCPTCSGRGFVSEFYWKTKVSEEVRAMREGK